MCTHNNNNNLIPSHWRTPAESRSSWRWRSPTVHPTDTSEWHVGSICIACTVPVRHPTASAVHTSRWICWSSCWGWWGDPFGPPGDSEWCSRRPTESICRLEATYSAGPTRVNAYNFTDAVEDASMPSDLEILSSFSVSLFSWAS